jgi:hypothetical protein
MAALVPVVPVAMLALVAMVALVALAGCTSATGTGTPGSGVQRYPHAAGTTTHPVAPAAAGDPLVLLRKAGCPNVPTVVHTASRAGATSLSATCAWPNGQTLTVATYPDVASMASDLSLWQRNLAAAPNAAGWAVLVSRSAPLFIASLHAPSHVFDPTVERVARNIGGDRLSRVSGQGGG